jgi:hypothetical protein
MTNSKMTTEQAKNIICEDATRPPQIDYVSPAEKAKVNEALSVIYSLPKAEREKAEEEIRAAIESYYGPTGAAQYDALF